MRETKKIILITNNRNAAEKYKSTFDVRFEKDYETVLLRTRDMVYSGASLLTHPQASSLKPNQTPVRSILLFPSQKGREYGRDCLLIEDALRIFGQWQETAPTPDDYEEAIRNDFETIDLSLIEGVAVSLM